MNNKLLGEQDILISLTLNLLMNSSSEKMLCTHTWKNGKNCRMIKVAVLYCKGKVTVINIVSNQKEETELTCYKQIYSNDINNINYTN